MENFARTISMFILNLFKMKILDAIVERVIKRTKVIAVIKRKINTFFLHRDLKTALKSLRKPISKMMATILYNDEVDSVTGV